MRKTFLAVLALLLAVSAIGMPPEDIPGLQEIEKNSDDVLPETEIGGETDSGPESVYVFPIREDIMPATVRLVHKCLNQASEAGADYIIINMNTYGGLVDAADSVRSMLLHSPVPVFTFVNNQAASAGALIALATDRIYMRPGASMGAATVVDQNGSEAPDKYQSFMRSMMRSTAEAHGKIAHIERGDTVWVWKRDPLIAEAMVDPAVVVPGLIDSGKVLTFTADEAVEWGYCEGKASTIEEVLYEAGIEDYNIIEYERSFMDKLIGFLTNPTFQAILIMLMVGGIYFELQTPGIGFALIVALLAAVLYFAPLYVEGLVAHWELALFIVGIILIILEIFITPGFGVLGISGIIAVVCGLAFALIDSSVLKHVPSGVMPVSVIVRPFLIVIIASGVGLILSIWLGNRFLKGRSRLRNRIVLESDMTPEDGYVSVAADRGLVGQQGVTTTPLRPSGKIMIDGKYYEAAGDNASFIEKGMTVMVLRDESGVLYCREIDSI